MYKFATVYLAAMRKIAEWEDQDILTPDSPEDVTEDFKQNYEEWKQQQEPQQQLPEVEVPLSIGNHAANMMNLAAANPQSWTYTPVVPSPTMQEAGNTATQPTQPAPTPAPTSTQPSNAVRQQTARFFSNPTNIVNTYENGGPFRNGIPSYANSSTPTPAPIVSQPILGTQVPSYLQKPTPEMAARQAKAQQQQQTQAHPSRQNAKQITRQRNPNPHNLYIGNGSNIPTSWNYKPSGTIRENGKVVVQNGQDVDGTQVTAKPTPLPKNLTQGRINGRPAAEYFASAYV